MRSFLTNQRTVNSGTPETHANVRLFCHDKRYTFGYSGRKEKMAATLASPVTHTELEPDRGGSEEESRGCAKTTEEMTGLAATGGHSRLSKLPLARIKALMKTDPDVSLASQESVFIIAKATIKKNMAYLLLPVQQELFVEMIAKDALVYAQQGKRKTLQRKDLDNAIEAVDEFAFLEGTLD
uniref:DNA polymerase epsilon subunit 4 isoform X1 n=1 Tax=Doryrhamphus excisus TaxID=161450 RepID=UPI0025AE8F09|nr:DNA polymerase epsilon subunit 4 isoform X1 [Doryrhamphus excisus]